VTTHIDPRRLWSHFVYASTGLVLGFAWLLVLAILLVLGGVLTIVLVGIPILALTLLLWRWGANTERERAALVLGHALPRPPATHRRGLAGWRARLGDRHTWRELGYMLLLGPVGIATGAVTVAAWSVVLSAIAAPAVAAAAPPGSFLGDLAWPLLALSVLIGIALVPVAVLVTTFAARGAAAAAGWLLEPNAEALLATRVSELEATRAGAVESADARLRRIERDLHDGAQHRLAYVAMELDRARAKLAEDPQAADALLAGAHEESKRALVELRDLVRGIHPSVLSDRGLDAAISGLAERCPVPVEIDVSLAARPPAAVETAAYYVVAEALTNVGRHADARTATVRMRDGGGRFLVEVSDDGRGGARRATGSGLEGLAQRVEALDGTFTVDSPVGGPTTIRAEMPCGS
jgi:signal transduction histidine kinase